MAKSTQSFNKKEREKKQQQKRQDKEQKREERKAHSNKGKGIEDMLAYVDDQGNISSVPPEPNKKKSIAQEDIQINIPKQSADDKANISRTGTVIFFDESKGYGFIKDHKTQESIFVHKSELLQPIKEKNKVSFEVENNAKGPTAVRVKLSTT